MAPGIRSMARTATWCGVGAVSAAASAYAARKLAQQRGFAGKVAVVTGSSRGLGLALAAEFGRRGARLALAARDPDELKRAVRWLVDKGAVRNESHALAVKADLRNRDEAEALIRDVTRHFGRVDVLVNNAGIITVGPVENQTVEQFEEVMDANFFSGLYCTLAVLPQMMERGIGSIANITSLGGKVAVPHMLPYTASKFAAVGFSEGLSAEVKRKGIRVTTVVPGLMRTGSHRNAFFFGDAEREYRWFSLSASLPGASIAADRAARQIVNGIARGAAEIAITPQAFAASRLANLAPGVTRTLLRAMNLLLPPARHGDQEKRRGEDVRDREMLPARTIGTAAARRYNQVGGMAS